MTEETPALIQTWLLKEIQKSDDRFEEDTSARPYEHFKLAAQGSGGASAVIRNTPWIPGEGWIAYIDRLSAALQAAQDEYDRENSYRDPDGFGSGGYGLPLNYLHMYRRTIVEKFGESK